MLQNGTHGHLPFKSVERNEVEACRTALKSFCFGALLPLNTRLSARPFPASSRVKGLFMCCLGIQFLQVFKSRQLLNAIQLQVTKINIASIF